MTNMRFSRRLTGLVLLLALCLTLAPPARAAETPVRHTDFFTDRPHADLDYADMRFEKTDVDAVLARMDEVRALAADAGNRDAVEKGFRQAVDDFHLAVTMSSLSYIRTCQNTADEAAAADNEDMEEAVLVLQDALRALARDILRSPCESALDEILTGAEKISLRWYVETDEALMELFRRESALESACRLEPERAGARFPELVAVRREIAETAGYDNYMDFAYACSFGRDYGPSDLDGFRAAARDELRDLLRGQIEAYLKLRDLPVLGKGYRTKAVQELMEPCLGTLSDELLEAFHYLRRHGLMDGEGGPGKSENGFTLDLPAYGTAFIFSNHPDGGIEDFVTAVHEFGHFNNNYWTGIRWDLSDKSIDVAEVHSQGLEMLFTRFYPRLFGEDAAAVSDYMLFGWIEVILESLMLDAFERYVYTTEDELTVRGLNLKMCELYREYGFLPENAPLAEMDAWQEVVHLFEYPGYVISYAVSAAGAFDFWLSAREDYFAAVDKYLRFTALDSDYGFADSFRAVGMASPLTARWVKDLAAALRESFGTAPEDVPPLPEAQPDGPIPAFSDVGAGSWYAAAVGQVCARGLMAGTGDGRFSPDGNLTRAQLVTILWRMEGEPAADGALRFGDVDAAGWYGPAVRWAASEGIVNGYSETVFGPGDDLTREQLMTILYRYAVTKGFGYAGDWTYLLGVPDRTEIALWAYEAACWMVKYGIVTGTGDGRLSPGAPATRAQAAVMLLRFADCLAAAETEAEETEAEAAEEMPSADAA